MAKIFALAVCLCALGQLAAAQAGQHQGRATYGEALQWYFDAATAGNAQAQFLLGLKYETGTDVSQNLREAAAWYEKAARQDLPEAQFKLATLLERGRGRTADMAAAAQWYERAARQGYAPAQYNLAVLRLNAAGNDAERIDGLVWLVRAKDQGVTAAEQFYARLAGQWPAQLIAAAERRALAESLDSAQR